MTIVISECVACKRPLKGPEDFKDELSVREFHISGLCQACQDEVFESEEADEGV